MCGLCTSAPAGITTTTTTATVDFGEKVGFRQSQSQTQSYTNEQPTAYASHINIDGVEPPNTDIQLDSTPLSQRFRAIQ